MASTYDQLISTLTTHWGWARSHHLSMSTAINMAFSHWYALDDHDCLYDVLQCLELARDCFADALSKGYYGYNGSTFTLITALDRAMANPFITEAPEFTLTMEAILNTMLTADPYQVEYFVGLVDAYRQSIWNKPFNSEFFAALARGFMEWP